MNSIKEHGLEIENAAPAYMLRDGGHHWVLQTSCGCSASALRHTDKDEWNIFDPYGEQHIMPAYLTDMQIRNNLRKMISDAIENSLKNELEFEKEDNHI